MFKFILNINEGLKDMIPEREVRKDLETVKDGFYHEAYLREARPIDIKREIGLKYGLSPKECSQNKHIETRILEYLRDIRNNKTEYTNEDIHDFYYLTNYISLYGKLEPFLSKESGQFLKYVLDWERQYIIDNYRIKPYTLDNIENIPLSNDITRGSGALRFKLERYKSIKKYYDENYGPKVTITLDSNKKFYDLETKLLEDTYEIQITLTLYLEDFIEECYKRYSKIYSSKKYTEIYNTMMHYYNLLKEKNPYYDSKHVMDQDELKWQKYDNALHLLIYTYNYFSSDNISKEQRIENSLDYFDKSYNRLINKNICRSLLSKDANIKTVKVGKLELTNYGFKFDITYNENKKLYVNFILQFEYEDISDLDKFIKINLHVNKFNYSTIAYEMKVTAKPLLMNNLNESFDFNRINLALDNYEDTEIKGMKTGLIEDKSYGKDVKYILENFVDLGLPSGTWWAKNNIGADCGDFPQDWYGSYYAWGDPDCDKKEWGEATYKFTGKMIKYNNYDHLINLLPEDDQATLVNTLFKTPSADLIQELMECTKMQWVDNYNKVNGLNGCLCINKKDPSKYIFIPAGGYHSWSGLFDEQEVKVAFASSTRYEKDPYRCYAGIVNPDDDDEVYPYLSGSVYRTMGFPIRPVLNM